MWYCQTTRSHNAFATYCWQCTHNKHTTYLCYTTHKHVESSHLHVGLQLQQTLSRDLFTGVVDCLVIVKNNRKVSHLPHLYTMQQNA